MQRQSLWICLALVALIFAVYGQVARFDFTNYDDPEYVTENPHISGPLTLQQVGWAMTSGYAGNWFPLTWLSHMLDIQLFGMNAGSHHLMNVVLHAMATIFLFLALRRMTGELWRSAFVAAMFALHPLRVESVAWISERKDVLSMFFWMLTLWLYARYAERPGWIRYLLVSVSFALGLMSKPMLVTLPFTLMLLDVWPLRRGLRIAEKLPLLALSAIVSIINYVVQHQAGAVMSLGVVPLSLRIENALVSYAMYLRMLIWPSNLAPFYPMPVSIPLWQPILAGLILVAISTLVFIRRRSHPYMIVGWLWYLGTLVPVLGLISFGAQARADRYTYAPLIGILIMVAWSMSATRIGTIAAVVIYGALAFIQTSYWRDSVTLFRHTIAVSENNYVAHNNLGVALSREGKVDEAIENYKLAMAIPRQFDLADPYINLGAVMLRKEKPEEAVTYLSKALEYRPQSAEAHANLGQALNDLDRMSVAIVEFREAIRLEPENVDAHAGLAVALARTGAADEAVAHVRVALTIRPNSASSYFDLGEVYGYLSQAAEAESAFRESIRLDPSKPRAYFNLGIALGNQGKLREASAAFREAIKLKPDYPTAWFNLGNALAQDGNLTGAVDAFSEAIRLQPDYAEARAALEAARTLR